MKIQLESYRKTYSVTTEYDDLDIDEYLELIKGLLVSSGFAEETVKRGIIELAESFKE
jgi:hypothetical protein